MTNVVRQSEKEPRKAAAFISIMVSIIKSEAQTKYSSNESTAVREPFTEHAAALGPTA